MKKLILLLFLGAAFSCSTTETATEVITKEDFAITISDQYPECEYYHVYWYNRLQRDKSAGLLIESSADLTGSVELYTGEYDIYIYGLSSKTEDSKKLFSAAKVTDFKHMSPSSLHQTTAIITPDIAISYDEESSCAIITISLKGLTDIITLSSLSVKQGTSRVRSAETVFFVDRECYEARLPVETHGIWLCNISYTVKNRKDSTLLKENDIQLSTSYFKDIYLGEF